MPGAEDRAVPPLDHSLRRLTSPHPQAICFVAMRQHDSIAPAARSAAAAAPTPAFRYNLWTTGCQMNEADAVRAAALLESAGGVPTDDAREADFVLLNTCAVRQQAEDKAYVRLRYVGQLRKRNPKLVVALMGCIVGTGRARTEALKAEYPFIDLFLPPSDLAPLRSYLAGAGLLPPAAAAVGTVSFEGGRTLISAYNKPVDAKASFQIRDGLLFACGSGTPQPECGIPWLLFPVKGSAGRLELFVSSDEADVLEAVYPYSTVYFAAPSLTEGQSYTLKTVSGSQEAKASR